MGTVLLAARPKPVLRIIGKWIHLSQDSEKLQNDNHGGGGFICVFTMNITYDMYPINRAYNIAKLIGLFHFHWEDPTYMP